MTSHPQHPSHPEHGHGHAPGHGESHGRGQARGPGHGHRAAHPPVAAVSGRTLILVALVAAAIFAALFIAGFWVHHDRLKKRRQMAEQIRDAPPVVQLVLPAATRTSFSLSLPADVRAWASTALYARTNGYLAQWKYDIFDRVKKGDVMAVIAAPDTDAELEQAEAELNQQETNHRLAVLTDERYRGLIPIRGVTQEQLDQNRSTRDQAAANVRSAAANVDRLKALVGFEKIIYTFDGVVTGRTYDVGALITASATGAGQELFDVAEDDKLRVFVSVPQPYVFLIKFGEPVQLALERNYPGHRFTGVVARATGTLDPATRTLRTELDFPNTDPRFKLYPGMYAEAIFQISREKPVLTIPTSALLFEPEGKEVAVVQANNRVHLQKIVPGSDFGTTMEVISGLNGNERIVANPGEEIAEGLLVKPVMENTGPSGGGKPNAPPAKGGSGS